MWRISLNVKKAEKTPGLVTSNVTGNTTENRNKKKIS